MSRISGCYFEMKVEVQRLHATLRKWRKRAEPALVTPPGGKTTLGKAVVVTVDEIDEALGKKPPKVKRAKP